MSIAEISKEVDKIIIDYKEFNKIQKWCQNDGSPMELMDAFLSKRVFFPLNTFILDIHIHRHNRLVLLIELENFNPLNGRVTGDNQITGNSYSFTYQRGAENKGWHFDGELPKPPIGVSAEEACQTLHTMLLSIFMYICCKSRDRIIKVSPQVTRKERENYEYRPRECFLLNDIIKYVSIHPNKSSIKYRCECWGVRGHIRHYQDGRTVFIKPYKKGAKRDILEPKSKTYLLTDE